MTDDEFLRAFFACELESLSHADHIRAGWLVLHKHSLHSAIGILSDGFRAFAAAKGKPEVYHETVTWAFLVLMHERIKQGRAGRSWREFLETNPELAAGRRALECFYSRERLDSQLAREAFVLP